MDGLLELKSAIKSASVVLYVDKIASLSHVHLPSAQLRHEAVSYHLRVRTSVNIYYCRILLVRIKVLRLDKSVIVVIFPVSALYSAERYLSVGVIEGGVFCREEISDN